VFLPDHLFPQARPPFTIECLGHAASFLPGFECGHYFNN
jgi:hypothetical protein